MNSEPDDLINKKLYDSLMLANKQHIETIDHFNKNIGIEKQIYVDKIANLNAQIENQTKKLNEVRKKQFGK